MVKWRRGHRSEQVIDRRGAPGGGRLSIPGGRLSLPVLLVLMVLGVCFGGDILGGGSGAIDLGPILEQLAPAPGGAAQGEAPLPPEADPDAELAGFMSFVLDDVQASWADMFRQAGREYPPAELVLFSGSTQSACGGATSAIGPHYCPLDERVYLDLDFFRELRRRFGAPGDFAQAYVLAHEIGHHVQNVTGIMDQVQQAQQGDPDRANDLSIRLELPADCFAGVWAYTTFERDLLDSGDLEEGIKAAEAVGDDRIQEQATGMVDPETWTHGSSDQRARWFRAGFDAGPNACDTFSGEV
ncbi:MAG: KPN_02809 family neutral zinc metallopeptidase [Acidimicrobiia bacterium]